MQVRDAKVHGVDEDWITIFENRSMAQEEKYNVPYRHELSLIGFLIPQQAYSESDMLDELELTTEQLVPSALMSVTIKQAQHHAMTRGKYLNIDGISSECIPLIAEHQNWPTFFGYWNVCTLASFIIQEFNLNFEGMELIKDGKVVAKYEAWQEGYQDEAYTREKLSLGVRLRVRRDLLAQICNHYHKMLCVRIDEKRECYGSIHDKKPEEMSSSRRYIVYYF